MGKREEAVESFTFFEKVYKYLDSTAHHLLVEGEPTCKIPVLAWAP
jgi:hypothetical protein